MPPGDKAIYPYQLFEEGIVYKESEIRSILKPWNSPSRNTVLTHLNKDKDRILERLKNFLTFHAADPFIAAGARNFQDHIIKAGYQYLHTNLSESFQRNDWVKRLDAAVPRVAELLSQELTRDRRPEELGDHYLNSMLSTHFVAWCYGIECHIKAEEMLWDSGQQSSGFVQDLFNSTITCFRAHDLFRAMLELGMENTYTRQIRIEPNSGVKFHDPSHQGVISLKTYRVYFDRYRYLDDE